MKLKDFYNKFIAPFPALEHQTFLYKYYKSNGWVVRKGCKFGCDFLLYINGPETDHSIYTVHIVMENTQFDVIEMLAACRSSKQVKKTALFVFPPGSGDEFSYGIEAYAEASSSFKPKEITLKRWKP